MIPIEQIHPFVLHFPIVFFLSLFLLDLYARLRNIPLHGRGGVANLSAGLAVLAGIGALIAAIFGSLALEVAEASGVPEEQTETHALLGGTTASALILWGLVRAFIWYRRLVIDNKSVWVIVFVEFAFSVLIATTAYYGGQLVYEFGVNVARPTG